MSTRQDWIDYSKGLGILLVVYGHSLNSATHSGLGISEFFQSFCDATFSNTIPVFFFLSGLFVERSLDKRDARVFLIERASRLVYPYLVWSILQGAAELAFSSQSLNGTTYETLLAIPYRPFEQFWFLYTLFLMFPAYVVARQAGRWSLALLVGAAIALFLWPLPFSALTLDRFSIHLIFFVAGILFSRYFVGARALRVPLWLTIPLTVVFFASAALIFTRQIDPRIAGVTHVEHRFYYLYLGTLLGAINIGWAQFLGNGQRLSVLRLMGVYSLQIYVAHMLFAVGFRIAAEKVFGTSEPFLIVAGCIGAGILGPMVLCVAMERVGLPVLFDLSHPVNPSRFAELAAVARQRLETARQMGRRLRS